MKNLRRSSLVVVAAAVSAVLNAIAAPPSQYSMNAPLLPDRTLSPGDTLSVTKADVCVPGYSKKVRNVPQRVKEQVYREYGITHRAKGEYEVDHIISLEIGGSNSIRNLFPQSYKTKPWNARVKDRLEDAFHADVCSGRIELADAQRRISQNWIDAYKRRFPNDPLAKLTTPAQAPIRSANSSIAPYGQAVPIGAAPAARHSAHYAAASTSMSQVWINTKSGVYWRAGTRYFGKTKQGNYMSEADALKAGFHAAKGQ